MHNIIKIKIGANGEQLPIEAPEWDAVYLPQFNIMVGAGNASDEALDSEAAATICSNLSLAGFNDWRVPERMELEAVLDLTKYKPAIDPVFFRDTHSDWYLTATPCAWSPGRVWFVGFSHGYVGDLNRYYQAFVRPVRSVLPPLVKEMGK